MVETWANSDSICVPWHFFLWKHIEYRWNIDLSLWSRDKRPCVQWKFPPIPFTKKTNVTPSSGKAMRSFANWEAIMADYVENGEKKQLRGGTPQVCWKTWSELVGKNCESFHDFPNCMTMHMHTGTLVSLYSRTSRVWNPAIPNLFTRLENSAQPTAFPMITGTPLKLLTTE